VLTDTVTDITTSVGAETGALRLEVPGDLRTGQVGSGKIGGTTDELGEDIVEVAEDGLGQLARGNRRVGRLVEREGLLPALGKETSEPSLKLSTLGGELLLVSGEELVPLLLGGSTNSSGLSVQIVHLLGHDEGLIGVETELCLDALGIISLEGVSMNTAGSLELGAVTDGGGELDDSRFVGDSLGFGDSLLHGLKILVTVLDVESVPAICLEPLHDILSECAVGITVLDNLSAISSPSKSHISIAYDGDVVVVVDGDQLAKLQMTGLGSGLGGNTFHGTSITEEAEGVVVEQVVTGLVKAGRNVSLGHGETDSIGETLTQRTSGDFNTGGVVLQIVQQKISTALSQETTYRLGVTRSLGSELLYPWSARGIRKDFHYCTYAEGPQVINGEVVAKQVQESILQHASVAVAMGLVR